MARGKTPSDPAELEKLEWPYGWPPPWRNDRLVGHELAERTMLAAQQSGQFLYANADLTLDLPQYRMNFDQDRIADLGMDVNSVNFQLSTLLAEMDANRFNAIYQEFSQAREVTARRMYLEMMESVLGGMNKVIIDPSVSGAGGVVPYLPLNDLQRAPAPPAPAPRPQAGPSQ